MTTTFAEAAPTDADWVGCFKRELTPPRAREIRTAIIVTGVVLCVIISMTLQVPELAITAYMIFFISKESKRLTTITAVGGIIGATIAIGSSLMLYKLTYGYPELPPNWESAAQMAENKPSTQLLWRTFGGATWGAASDDSDETEFSRASYPNQPSNSSTTKGIGYAPFSYWQRSLDAYTWFCNKVDTHVGNVVSALPEELEDNTIIVFTADHGEFAGAHGLLAGKIGTNYEEAFHIPLIVVDNTGRYATDIDTPRTDGSSNPGDNIAPGGTLSGVINNALDHDFFRIHLTGATTYNFNVLGNGATTPTLALHDSTGGQLASVVGGTPLNFTAGATGDYYLDVGGLNGSTGSYTLIA